MANKKRIASIKSLSRKVNTREEEKTYLIVCEGKTEENYFKALCNFRQNVTVTHQASSCPLNIAEYANDEIDKGDYRAVICVFDKEFEDSRKKKFEQAKSKLFKLSKKHKDKTIIAAWTIPQFEFWYILHFIMCDQPFYNNQAIESLLREQSGFKDYDKSAKNHYDLLSNKIEIAISNAKELKRRSECAEFDNPLTTVHEAVEFLRKEFPMKT